MVAGHCGSRPQPTHGLARAGSSPCTGAGDRGGGYGPRCPGPFRPSMSLHRRRRSWRRVRDAARSELGVRPRAPQSPAPSACGGSAEPRLGQSRGRIVAEAIRHLGRPILDKPGPIPPLASRRQSAPRACIGSRAAGLDQRLLHGPPDDLLRVRGCPPAGALRMRPLDVLRAVRLKGSGIP